MLALYRSGRQADALNAYRRARQQLVSQLGIEPDRRFATWSAACSRRIRRSTDGRGRSAAARADPSVSAIVLAGIAGICAAVAALGADRRGLRRPAVPRTGWRSSIPGRAPSWTRSRSTSSLGRSRPGPAACGWSTPGAPRLRASICAPWRCGQAHRRHRREARETSRQGRRRVWIADFCSVGGSAGAAGSMSSPPGTGHRAGPRTSSRSRTRSPPKKLGWRPSRRRMRARRARPVGNGRPPNVFSGIVRVDFDRASGDSAIVESRRAARGPASIAIGAGSVWATDTDQGVVRRIDPTPGGSCGSSASGNAAGSGRRRRTAAYGWSKPRRRVGLPHRPENELGEQD